MNRRLFWLILILLLGTLLRVASIDALPLWIDEGFSYLAVKSPDLFTALLRDVHPPLYFTLLKLWTDAAGVSELAFRYPSALMGVLSVALMVPFTREVMRLRGGDPKNDTVPLIAAALMAVSEMGFYVAQEVRSYSLHIVLAILSMWMFLRWARTGSRVSAVIWIAAMTALLYTHYLGAWVGVVQGLYALIFLRGRWRVLAIAALLIPAALFALWLVGVVLPYQTLKADSDATIDASTLDTLVRYAREYLTGQWALMLGLFGLGLVHLDGGRVRLRPLRASALTLLWIVVPVLLTFIGNTQFSIMTNYRLSQIIIPLTLIWAFGIATFKPPVRAFLVGAVIVYGVFSVDFGKLYFPWDTYARLITDRTRSGDLALMDFKGVDFSMEYYLEQQLSDDVRVVSLRQTLEWTPDALYSDVIPALNAADTVWLARWNDSSVGLDLLRDAGLRQTAFDTFEFQGIVVEARRFDRIDAAAEPVAEWANGMRLLRAAVDSRAERVDLLWGTAQPLDSSYTVSAFLLDAAGALVAQDDAPPTPTTDQWALDAVIYSAKPVTMANSIPLTAGVYQVGVKVYQWSPDGITDIPLTDGEPFAIIGTLTIAE